jgi:hypothetical protein
MTPSLSCKICNNRANFKFWANSDRLKPAGTVIIFPERMPRKFEANQKKDENCNEAVVGTTLHSILVGNKVLVSRNLTDILNHRRARVSVKEQGKCHSSPW